MCVKCAQCDDERPAGDQRAAKTLARRIHQASTTMRMSAYVTDTHSHTLAFPEQEREGRRHALERQLANG